MEHILENESFSNVIGRGFMSSITNHGVKIESGNRNHEQTHPINDLRKSRAGLLSVHHTARYKIRNGL